MWTISIIGVFLAKICHTEGGGGGQYIYGSIQKDGGIRLFLIKTRAPHILRPFHPSELASCEAAEIQATLRTKRLQKGKSFHE